MIYIFSQSPILASPFPPRAVILSPQAENLGMHRVGSKRNYMQVGGGKDNV